jgi:phosphate/sulfate permease
MELALFIVILLLILAVVGLIVGVSNDAVNFVNSAVGSKAAKFNVILTFAVIGLLVGVTFSSGMMDVAKSGIFHPEYFGLLDIMFIFLSVMLTSVLLLDLFNTFGLPTSTTIALVAGLFGSAFAISFFKLLDTPEQI